MAELSRIEPVLDILQDLDLPLLVHGETNGYSPDREREFVAVYDRFATQFPKLRITMEHITTEEAATFLDKHDNVFATITLHHLLYTMDDMLGGMFNPFLFCKTHRQGAAGPGGLAAAGDRGAPQGHVRQRQRSAHRGW